MPLKYHTQLLGRRTIVYALVCTYVLGVCERQCPSQAQAVRLSSPMLWRPLDPGGSEASATLRLVWPGRRRGGCSRRELSQGRCFGDVGSRVWSPLTGAVATARGVPSYVGRFSRAAVKNSTLPVRYATVLSSLTPASPGTVDQQRTALLPAVMALGLASLVATPEFPRRSLDRVVAYVGVLRADAEEDDMSKLSRSWCSACCAPPSNIYWQ